VPVFTLSQHMDLINLVAHMYPKSKPNIESLRPNFIILRRTFHRAGKRSPCGFTLIEITIVMAILGALAGITIPQYTNYIERAKITRAIAEISILQTEIYTYKEKNESLPDTLNEIGRETLLDPWGNPYDYLNFDTLGGKGKGKKKPRKDHFLHPINTDFDLCSMGKDGKTNAPLTASASRDDIIRANNGTYIGLASEY